MAVKMVNYVKKGQNGVVDELLLFTYFFWGGGARIHGRERGIIWRSDYFIEHWVSFPQDHTRGLRPGPHLYRGQHHVQDVRASGHPVLEQVQAEIRFICVLFGQPTGQSDIHTGYNSSLLVKPGSWAVFHRIDHHVKCHTAFNFIHLNVDWW